MRQKRRLYLHVKETMGIKLILTVALLVNLGNFVAPLSLHAPKIDLRSDTVTKPTPAMRTAMFESEVGDDVFGEDPTINGLETRIAKLFQKEASLFFPTGTMSNLAATMAWCNTRGSEIILGDSSHIFLYEQAGASQIGGVSPRPLPNNADGTIDIDRIEEAIRGNNIHFPTTSLITLENTHNFCGGKVLPVGYMEAVRDLGKQRDMPIHLDGARIWNAATTLQIPVHELVKDVDSASVCLSKGLGAPAGSLLLGSRSLIDRARRLRKVLGGGMRQAGVIAAAGMVALDDFEQGVLVADHLRAKMLAAAIGGISVFRVYVEAFQSNVVLVGIDSSLSDADAIAVSSMLKDLGVFVLPIAPFLLRLVTHRDISEENVLDVVTVFRQVGNFICGPVNGS